MESDTGAVKNQQASRCCISPPPPPFPCKLHVPDRVANRAFSMPFSEKRHFSKHGAFSLINKNAKNLRKCLIFVYCAFFHTFLWSKILIWGIFFIEDGAFFSLRRVGNPGLPESFLESSPFVFTSHRLRRRRRRNGCDLS